MSYMTRYRIPLDWILLLCAAAAVLAWGTGLRDSMGRDSH